MGCHWQSTVRLVLYTCSMSKLLPLDFDVCGRKERLGKRYFWKGKVKKTVRVTVVPRAVKTVGCHGWPPPVRYHLKRFFTCNVPTMGPYL